ncbi:MAG: DegV family protein [Anaerolineaceae bacterium]
MPSSCIIADNAAQFTRVNFPENVCLRFINFKTEYSFVNLKDNKQINSLEFPKHLPLKQDPIVRVPDFDEIREVIDNSVNHFDEVFIILHSKEINPAYATIMNLLNKLRGRAVVHLIDSQSLSIGQGFLIQSAVDLISKNTDGNLIEETLREQIPHIYTLLCTPGTSYLHNAGFIDKGQGLIGEMLSLLPIFSLEDGKFNPIDKLKNIHGVIDYFIEYIEEFDNLLQVSFLQSTPPAIQETKMIKQYLEENYPNTLYTEHPHNNYLASLIGPKGFGMVVIEKTE